MKFGDIIRDLRRQKGISVKRLSEGTKIPASTLRQLEYGRIPSHIKTYKILADYFQISLSRLMFGTPDEKDEILKDLDTIKAKIVRMS